MRFQTISLQNRLPIVLLWIPTVDVRDMVVQSRGRTQVSVELLVTCRAVEPVRLWQQVSGRIKGQSVVCPFFRQESHAMQEPES